MRKSLFQKYFTVCASLIICLIIILGGLLLIFATSYFREDKYSLLGENAQRAANMVTREYKQSDNGRIDATDMKMTFSVLATAIDAEFFFVNTDGKCALCTEDQPCVHMTYTIPQFMLDTASSDGEFTETGNLGGIYQASYYTVGVPVISDGALLGYVFASSSTESLNEFLVNLLRMFLLSSIVVLAVASVILYFVTMQMVKPLREMAQAAHSFSEEDFSVRLPIYNEDEIGQLARSLNQMAESLSVVEKNHRSFTSNVAHELRTPMTSIAGFIDGILDGTIPPQDEKKYLRIVSEEVGRLSRLVKSMLNLSRLEAGEMKLNPEAFNVVEVVCRIAISFERRIEEKHVDIKGLDHPAVTVQADRDLIHQVLYNLTENAVKFVNEGGEISFSFTEEGNQTCIAVRNTGAGLSEEEAARVFDRFYKADKSRGQDTSGAGLGLHIARSIVRLHGGEIRVASEEGQYTEFSFTLPMAEKPPRRPREVLPSDYIDTDTTL